MRSTKGWTKFFGSVVCLMACAALLQAQPSPPRARGKGQFVPGRILVKFHDGTDGGRIADILAVQGVQESGQIPEIGVHILQLPPGAIESVYVHSFEQQPEVEFAEVDQIVAPSSIIPNDPYYPSQWADTDISLPAAWSTTTGSSSVVIAILDTGVNAVADIPSTKFVAGCDTYDDPNCLNPSTNIPDVSGHGTETAGVAAAVGNNGIGVASPCWGCSIMPMRVTDATGNAWVSAVAAGLTWASSHGAKVAYLGFALDSSPTVMSAAQTFYNNAGVVVMPAGNSGFESNPASPYAIIVSGVDSNNVIDPASSYGNDVDLAAPFTDYTTGPTSGTYGQVSGTSFSAALVAGTAGLVLSKNSCLSASQVTSILQTTATPLGVAAYYGSGLVNASGAVTLAGTTTCGGGKTNTTTALTSSLNPSTYGQSVTFTATVSPATATGSVTFNDGATPIGTGNLVAGVATYATASLAAGGHSITASYGGDTNDNGSTSGAVSQTVNKASTTTTITTNLSTATVTGQGYSVSFSLTVTAPGAGTPTGTVTISDGAASCAATLPATSCTLTSTTAGAKTVTATYGGDANFNGSASAGVAHTVNKAGTTTTITSNLSTATTVNQGYSVAFSLTVTAPGAGTPTGTVTISDGTDNCTATLPTMSCTLTSTTSGAKTITATYNGDANFSGSVSAGVAHTVNPSAKQNTTTTITSNLSTATVVGQGYSVTFTITVTSGSPTGTVTVSDGTASCVATLPATSCTLTSTTAGAKTVTATYSGDANFNGSTSAGVAHTVNKASTTTTITTNLSTATVTGQGYSVAFSLTVNAPGAGSPSGTVTISDGANSCVATLPATSCTLTSTTAGAKTVTATYNGDSNFNGSASAGVAHTVNKASTTTTITTNLSTATTVNQGYSVAFSLTVTSPGAGTPTGTVTISDGTDSCTATLPTMSCTLTSTTSGNKTITATYNGDVNFLGSVSPGVAHTVNPADTTPPTVSITAPTNGATVSGSAVTVSASASDNVGVTKVEFYLDGVLQFTDTTSPYSWTWNTTTATNASHTLTAKAYDAAGNVGTSAAVSVTVNNSAPDTTPPTVSFTSPAANSSFRKGSAIPVSISASDNVGVVRVEFYVDGVLTTTWTSGPYSTTWNAPNNPSTHTLQTKAYDAAGNVGTATETVTLTVH